MRKRHTALEQKLVDSYHDYTNQVFDYYEKFSKDLIGYEPKQILLLHGNWLEADHIGELADLMRKRGYRFITLEDALSDQAYSLPDTYVHFYGKSSRPERKIGHITVLASDTRTALDRAQQARGFFTEV